MPPTRWAACAAPCRRLASPTRCRMPARGWSTCGPGGIVLGKDGLRRRICGLASLHDQAHSTGTITPKVIQLIALILPAIPGSTDGTSFGNTVQRSLMRQFSMHAQATDFVGKLSLHLWERPSLENNDGSGPPKTPGTSFGSRPVLTIMTLQGLRIFARALHLRYFKG